MDLWVASSSKIAHRSGDSMTPSRETRVESISLRIAVLLLCRTCWTCRSTVPEDSRSPPEPFGCVSLVRAGQRGLRLADRGLGNRVGELVAADEREDRREGEQRDRAEHPERLLEAAGEGGGCGITGVHQRLGVARGHARGDRDPDRSAELLRGVQEPGRETGLGL